MALRLRSRRRSSSVSLMPCASRTWDNPVQQIVNAANYEARPAIGGQRSASHGIQMARCAGGCARWRAFAAAQVLIIWRQAMAHNKELRHALRRRSASWLADAFFCSRRSTPARRPRPNSSAASATAAVATQQSNRCPLYQ